jgi:alkanesulfonate monooxygenase SsuD/methylene tetrahydromethanopterin reductase-like flavin-dependent oxidoreductase (luciferase family)
LGSTTVTAYLNQLGATACLPEERADMNSPSADPTGNASDPRAQVHLGVFYTGVGPQLIWADPSVGPHVAIETFTGVVRLLERGLFDAFFLGEGLRVRENRGRVHDLDVAGRPDAITQLSALAGATERIGLVATQNATYNFPADLARRLASLDLLSDGRAGWNIVTTDNAWTGENFRCDSDGGGELAARHADVVFSHHSEYGEALAYARDIRARLARHGRSPQSVRILPGASVVLGDTPAEAQERARWVRREQISAPRALAGSAPARKCVETATFSSPSCPACSRLPGRRLPATAGAPASRRCIPAP